MADNLSLIIPTIPAYSYVHGQTQFNELLAHTLLVNLEVLAGAGYEMQVTDNTDYSALSAEFDAKLSALSTWFESALEEPEIGGTPRSLVPVDSSLPELVLDTGTTLVTWAAGGYWALAAKFLVELGLKWLEHWLFHDTGADLSDLKEVLQAALLNEDGSSKIGELDLQGVVDVLEQIADQEGIVELDGIRVFLKSHIVED